MLPNFSYPYFFAQLTLNLQSLQTGLAATNDLVLEVLMGKSETELVNDEAMGIARGLKNSFYVYEIGK